MNLLKFPHSAMFVSVTACRKTEFLLKLLETVYMNHFEFIVILCPTISDNKTYFSRKWIFDDKNVFIVCDVEGKFNEWIRLFKSVLKGHQTLFIIDDCSAEGEINKKQDALSELAFSGRHRNHSLWVFMQKYNSVSKDVREQIKWLCLFFTKDRDSFGARSKFWGGGRVGGLRMCHPPYHPPSFSKQNLKFLSPYPPKNGI